MSQIDPNDYDESEDMGFEDFEDWGDQPVEQRAWAGHPRPPVRPPIGWQPGFPPPGTRPPFGPVPPMVRPPRPPGPGKWPFWGYWGYRMLAAWRDIKFLKKLVGEIVEEDIIKAIEVGIIAPGPNSPVPGPGGPPGAAGVVTVGPNAPANPTTGTLWYDTTTLTLKLWNGTAWVGVSTLTGVTDGSQAPPGQVGEVLNNTTTGSYTATTGQTQTLTTLTLTPGDWDVMAWWVADADPNIAGFPSATFGIDFVLSPVPTGASSNMNTHLDVSFPGADVAMRWIAISPRAQINVSAPTPLLFTLMTNIIPPTGLNLTGTFKFYVQARRAR